jgi:hypothetical protein
MTKRFVLFAAAAFAASVGTASLEGRASADETSAKPGTVTLKPTTVVGRAKRPSVVIEVTRAKPDVKLADLADPAVEKIVRAASKAPF